MMSTVSPIYRRLYDFIDILRDAEINISTDEVLQVFSALQYISPEDREIFRQTLQTTLIKDFTDIPVFDRCFKEFFQGLGEDKAALSLLERQNDNLTGDEAGAVEDLIDGFHDTLEESDLFARDPQDLLALFLDEMEEEAESGGGMGNLFSMSRSLLVQQQNRQGPAGSGEPTDQEAHGDLLLEMLNNRIEKRRIGTEIRDREDFLFNRNIHQLTPDEIREMRFLIQRFGQKLKNRISLRKKKLKHGGIDIKRTLRASLQFDGIPFRIFHRDRKIDRPQVVILCDVSGSVSQYTRFMLLLTHTLQSLFSKVRTFAFISNLVEITDLFMEMDPERAINSIFEDTDFTYGWGSNYGQSFEQFMSGYSDSLNKKTTILVLGDGRNNNQDPGLEAFMKMKDRSRNLFWLNPDKQHLWDWSDSIATLYQKYCTEMKEVNTFLDLSDFIDRLFDD